MDEPVSAAGAPDAVDIGGEAVEVGLGDGLLVGDGVVDAALGASADLLEDALGRVQFGAVGRKADAGSRQVGEQLGAMGADTVVWDGAVAHSARVSLIG